MKHEGDPKGPRRCVIDYTKGGKLYRVKAKSVIMADGSWTTKHIVLDMPQGCRDAYAQFHRAPCLMANVAVRNWRFLYDMGLTECQWFEGIGNSMTIRKVATFGHGPGDDQSRHADCDQPENSVFLSRRITRGTDGARPDRIACDAVPDLRTAHSRTVTADVRKERVRREPRYRRDHSQSMGTRLSQPAAGIFLRP